MRSLLDELGARLKIRGVKASIYLVGGAAMTLDYGRDGLTPDIDAVISHQAVLEEAQTMAKEHGSIATLVVGCRRVPHGRDGA
jgi:hypothetical protein